MKKPIIIGMACGLIAAIYASKYLISKKNENDKPSNNNKPSSNEKNKYSSNEEYRTPKNETVSETYIDLRQQRQHTAATISERHNTAAQIITETLEENEQNSNHKLDFNEIDSNLNKLLDEE